MQLYEAAYELKTCLLLFVLLCLTADPAQLEYSVVCALICTFIVMYFSARSLSRSFSLSLCLPTFGHFLIVNKTSLSVCLSLSLSVSLSLGDWSGPETAFAFVI
jgi:hypothetical protein